MNVLLLCFAMSTAVSAAASADPVVYQTSEKQIALLELFTSEGCSSCPPAERWLSGLKAAPALWREFVPLAFHVDYWDHLGWRDPWGAREFSDRQRAYAAGWRRDSIYTPGFVLNGLEWRPASRPKDGPRSSGAKAGVLAIRSADLKRWVVHFTPVASAMVSYEFYAALLASGLGSDVTAGENQGQRLEHDFVVLILQTAPTKASGGITEGQVVLDPAGRAAAGRLAIAVWVTRTGSLEPIQAVGGWLPHQ